jgi:acyl-coenzyme A synthetase/AMP-(fatty) acid ligase
MLYERWKIISAARRDETALRDFASGRRWTFGELFSEGEKVTPVSGPVCSGKIIFPQGHSPEFIFQLLAAWRETKIACPLETGQGGASVLASRFDSSHQVRLAGTLAPPIVHFKTTSATTGDSRLVAFTAEQLAADAENIVATMGLRADWPNLGVISLAHSYGFSNLILLLLLHGIPLILAPAPLPEIIRRAAESEKFLTLAAVPAMWRAWHEAKAIPKNIRLAISAGAPLPLNLEQDIFKSSGLKIHNFLGSSECGGIAYDATDLPRTNAACVGAPMRNVNLSLNDDGCLVVRSRAVGETYWPEKSDSLGGGIFQTSDLAELKDDKVFLRGRLSDQINVAGRKISPETIERALLVNPKVRDCLVFGAASFDAERTEIIIAVVVSDAKENELKQFLLQTIPAWQVPREWKFVESLSANTRGKISRAAWRATFVRERT